MLIISLSCRLIFLALFILAVLALCGVLISTWVGYQSMRKEKSPSLAEPGHGPTDEREVPTSTNPINPSSALSTPHAEPLHNQTAPSQSRNASSASAGVGAELSGDGHHDYQVSHV